VFGNVHALARSRLLHPAELRARTVTEEPGPAADPKVERDAMRALGDRASPRAQSAMEGQ
jgi:hypothetical protein